MNATPTRLHDPRILADEIRELAARAYQTLHAPLTDARETRKLSQRITELQDVTGDLASDELALWLENLQRRINAPAQPAATVAKPRRLTSSPTQ